MKKKPMTIREMASLGGKASRAALTPKQRSEAARRAAAARWGKRKPGN